MNGIQGPYTQSRNFAGLKSPYSDYHTSKAVILPVPYDGTSEWHSGSRDGPYSIIDSSAYLEYYDIELDAEVSRVGIHTLPALQPSFESPLETINIVKTEMAKLIKANKFVAMLGGEHSVTTGAVQAFKDRFQNLSVLHLDAHADLRDEYTGTRYSHACVIRRVFDICPVTQAGIRSLSMEEREFIRARSPRTFFYTENMLDDLTIDQIIATLSDDVYITIDLDVLDPSIMSAVGTPEPGGMKWQEILKLLRGLSIRKNIVGFDVVELCPSQGPVSCSFLAAKLVYKLIGYSLISRTRVS